MDIILGHEADIVLGRVLLLGHKRSLLDVLPRDDLDVEAFVSSNEGFAGRVLRLQVGGANEPAHVNVMKMKMIQSQLEELAFQVNESFLKARMIEDEKKNKRIMELEQERADAGSEFELYKTAWNNPKEARPIINRRITALNKANLASLPLKQRLSTLPFPELKDVCS